MKTITFFLVSLFIAFAANAEKHSSQGDSIIVQFGNNTRMVIHAKDKAGIAQLKNYDLNKIVRDMGLTLDSSNSESYIFLNEKTGRKYLKDTVLIISRQDGKVKISINEPENNDEKKVEQRSDNESKDSDDTKVVRRRRFSSPRNGFNINLGLNAYGQNTTGNYMNGDYDLNPFGSRFVSLGLVRGTPIAKGKNASLGLDFGIDVSWYNLMFEGNNTVRKDANNVGFPMVMNNQNQPIEFSKSKLVASYLNASLMPTVAFHKGFVSFISAGVYGGYRLGSYTKTKTAGSGSIERLSSNYFLNSFRYGIAFELGIRRFPDLFVNYDLNSLYEDSKGPNVRMMSFGIRL